MCREWPITARTVNNNIVTLTLPIPPERRTHVLGYVCLEVQLSFRRRTCPLSRERLEIWHCMCSFFNNYCVHTHLSLNINRYLCLANQQSLWKDVSYFVLQCIVKLNQTSKQISKCKLKLATYTCVSWTLYFLQICFK